MTEKISLGPPPGAADRSKSDSWGTHPAPAIPSPDPVYDTFVSVKESPRMMAIPSALVGRFIDRPTAPVRPSRRARARQRALAARP
jgi:hypothetical protein